MALHKFGTLAVGYKVEIWLKKTRRLLCPRKIPSKILPQIDNLILELLGYPYFFDEGRPFSFSCSGICAAIRFGRHSLSTISALKPLGLQFGSRSHEYGRIKRIF